MTYTWTPRENNRSWKSVASSSDGIKLIASEYADSSGGRIYTSIDGGITWTPRESNREWFSVASSSDGTKLVALDRAGFQGGNGGKIYTSNDSGITWTERGNNQFWRDVASSSDGTKLVAVADNNGQIYTSTDSGISWTARESNREWVGIASSSDGAKLVAVVDGGQIYTSVNSGVTWTARESNREWISVASSSDGTKLVAVVTNGQIYTSTDSGASWTARENNRNWRDIAISSNGNKMVAIALGDQIYTSNDSGVSWTAIESSRAWCSVAISSDGTKLVAGVNGGQIYTGVEPITTTTTTSAPQYGSCNNRQSSIIQLKRGTNAEFAASNIVLSSGEPGYAIDTRILKIGDGITSWSQLLPVNMSGVISFPDILGSNNINVSIVNDDYIISTVGLANQSHQHVLADITDYNDIYSTQIYNLGTVSGVINIDWAVDKQIQTGSLDGTVTTINKGSNWPATNNISRDVLLDLSVSGSSTNMSWPIVTNWYSSPPNPLPVAKHLVLLRAMGTSIYGHYLGSGVF